MAYSMISHNFNIIQLTARTNTAIPKFCHCCNDKAITAHIMKIALTRTACFFNSGWKFPPKTQKKQQWLFQSLLLKMSVSYRNRTYNRVLGGPRYIHLTKETNAVFPGFFDPLAPAAIIYNSITSVMNYLFLISSDFSDFASLSDPQTLPFFFKWVPSWFYLRSRPDTMKPSATQCKKILENTRFFTVSNPIWYYAS